LDNKMIDIIDTRL